MAEREEYIEACREAKDALYDLLMMTEPDTGQKLRVAYSELKGKIHEHEGEDPEVAREKDEEQRAKYERRNAWRRTSMERRDAYVFQYLGDERHTIGELAEHIKQALHVDFDIYENMVRAHVTRMFKEGKIQREGEKWHSRVRYRYYRPRKLEGPIADLQKQFEQDEEAGE